MKQFCLVVLVLFVAQSFADVSYITRGDFTSQIYKPTYSVETESDYVEPPIRIPGNTFTGTYTSSRRDDPGLRTYICVDRWNQLHGSYDELGMIQAFVTSDSENGTVAEGFFYEAGTGACVWGEIKLLLTTWGFKGTFNCGGEGDEYPIEEIKLNAFRPSDDQCLRLDLVTNSTLDGKWQDTHGHALDLCVTEKRWQLSYLREADNYTTGDPLQEGYAIGTTFVNGKVLSGTWYENDSAGAIIIFYRDNGELQYWRWTGLLGNQGRTIIDLSQFYNEKLHRTVYYPSHVGHSSPKNCSRFSTVKDHVLTTLRQDDGDYYYFIEDDQFSSEFVNIYYTSATTVFDSSATGILISFVLLVVTLAMVI